MLNPKNALSLKDIQQAKARFSYIHATHLLRLRPTEKILGIIGYGQGNKR